MCAAVQCNALCNTHCNAKINHFIPKFYSWAVILLRSSFAMADIIPKILVFSYVILLQSSAVQCKLQRTLMTSFQKLLQSSAVPYKLHCTLITTFLNFCSGAVQCTKNCNALCHLEWTLLVHFVFHQITVFNLCWLHWWHRKTLQWSGDDFFQENSCAEQFKGEQADDILLKSLFVL